MPSHEEIRQQHIALLSGMIPEHLERLNWSRQQIDTEMNEDPTRIFRVSKGLLEAR